MVQFAQPMTGRRGASIELTRGSAKASMTGDGVENGLGKSPVNEGIEKNAGPRRRVRGGHREFGDPERARQRRRVVGAVGGRWRRLAEADRQYEIPCLADRVIDLDQRDPGIPAVDRDLFDDARRGGSSPRADEPTLAL